MQIQSESKNARGNSSEDPRDAGRLAQSEELDTNRADTENTHIHMQGVQMNESHTTVHQAAQYAMLKGSFPASGALFYDGRQQQAQLDCLPNDNQSTITKPTCHMAAGEVQKYHDYTFKKQVGDAKLDISRGSISNQSLSGSSILYSQANHVVHEIDLGAARYGEPPITQQQNEGHR